MPDRDTPGISAMDWPRPMMMPSRPRTSRAWRLPMVEESSWTTNTMPAQIIATATHRGCSFSVSIGPRKRQPDDGCGDGADQHEPEEAFALQG